MILELFIPTVIYRVTIKFTFKAFHWMLAKILNSSICSHLSRTRIRRACLEIMYLIYFKFLKPIHNFYK